MMKFCEFDQENQENWKLLTRKNQENAKYDQENQENIIIFGYHPRHAVSYVDVLLFSPVMWGSQYPSLYLLSEQ